MTPDQILRDKLRKIEALFGDAATPGEKAAAGAAAERIRGRLGQAAGKEKSIELKFSISDVWSRAAKLLIWLTSEGSFFGAYLYPDRTIETGALQKFWKKPVLRDLIQPCDVVPARATELAF